MCESLGKGPRPNATPSTLHYRNSKIAPSGVWLQPVGIWSFSARHHRLNAKRRRLASWFDFGTKSGWSTTISTAHRAVAPGGANAGRNYGPQRGLAPDRMRLCRTLWAAHENAVAQRSDLCSLVSPAVARSTCAQGGRGPISCTCAKVTPEKQQTAGRGVKRGVSA